ncbi:glycosyltransferase [Glutamicibacter ardleyensis]|uniref:glycosyltransferase n=1 Tax=Glutamicibacter ardleyensis TaxID=225894 RepID=UPI003FCFAD24
MRNYGDKLHAPFVFYTRFGIGVFDEAWLDFRVRAFGAFTLPSVTALMRPQDRWFIFLDRDMPSVSLASFKAHIADHPAKSNIELVFVNYAFEVSNLLEDRLKHQLPSNRMYLTRIDDDDALRYDTIHKFVDLAMRTDSDNIFMSSTSAIECFPVERLMLQGPHNFLVNVAYGNANDVQGFARVGHTNLLAWAEKSGKTTARLAPEDAIFLYNRHRQSSSRFTSRRTYAREHQSSRKWAPADFRAFNLDVDKLIAFRAFAGAAPYSQDGSLWTDSNSHTEAAFESWKALTAKKTELMKTRTNLLRQPIESA